MKLLSPLICCLFLYLFKNCSSLSIMTSESRNYENLAQAVAQFTSNYLSMISKTTSIVTPKSLEGSFLIEDFFGDILPIICSSSRVMFRRESFRFSVLSGKRKRAIVMIINDFEGFLEIFSHKISGKIFNFRG